jgi:hypothetical protein
MRWPFEKPRKQTWKDWVLFAAVVLLPPIAEAIYVQLKPLDPQVVQAEAFWCQWDYARARTMKDTLRLDEGYRVVTASEWQRTPTCGEVRKANRLPHGTAPAAPERRGSAPAVTVFPSSATAAP